MINIIIAVLSVLSICLVAFHVVPRINKSIDKNFFLEPSCESLQVDNKIDELTPSEQLVSSI